jgi:hypothetical protein
LVSQHPESEICKTQARFKNLMTFRPHTTSGLTHKKLAYAMATKQSKVRKAKLIATVENPELQQIKAAKLENEKMKTNRILLNKQRAKGLKSMVSDGYTDEEDEVYERGNKNVSRAFESFEEDYEDDDFGNFWYFILVVRSDEEEERDSRLLNAKREAANEETKIKRLRIEESDSDGE